MGNTDKTVAVGLSATLRGVTEGTKFLPTGEPVRSVPASPRCQSMGATRRL